MIIFLLMFAAVLYFAEKYSLEHAFDKLEFKTSTDQALVEPLEAFCWTMTVSNGKNHMVPYLRIREQVPEGLCFADSLEPVEEKGQKGLLSVLYLSRREKVEQKRQVAFLKRGRYFFRGAMVEAGDFIGIQSITENFQELEEVVVKPAPWEAVDIPKLLGGYLGEFTVRQSMFEDPILIRGFREYTGREPFRAISWSQSARHGKLLVKEFEEMADMSCTVLLDVGEGKGEDREPLLEGCFSMARSICEELEQRQVPYDFRTNGVIAGAMGSWNQIEEGLGAGHLEAVLEGLGRMTYESREREEMLFSGILRSARPGRAIVLVAPGRSAAIGHAKSRLEERTGRRVLLMVPEGEASPGVLRETEG